MTRKFSAIGLLTIGALVAVSGCAGTAAVIPSHAPQPSAHDFDFEQGDWTVHHRTKKPGQTAWTEFDGTCRGRLLIDGSANVEEHLFRRAAGVTYGIALRAYDAKSHLWAIWWVDARNPHGAIDPPLLGKFEDGLGTFYSEAIVDGINIRTRFIWSHITATSARWEQAGSSDDGKTWETNWVMDFKRTASAQLP